MRMQIFIISLLCAIVTAISMNETLREAGDRCGLLMGSQFKYDPIIGTPDKSYRGNHSKQYSLSTVGNMCKWHTTHPTQTNFSLDKCIASFAYANSVKQKFRGHNLCWGNDNPSWLVNGKFSANEMRSILQQHITTVMQGVKRSNNGTGPLAWDVVNEACSSNPSSPLKDNTWYPKVPDYVDVAFKAARDADPDTLLFYNDYGVNQLGKKSDTMFALVSSMLSRDIPIDGVGMQLHEHLMSLDEVNTWRISLENNIERFTKLGLQVHITEMDIKCPEPCSASNLQQQAAIYAAALTACLKKPGCKSFETWGFTDGWSWLNGARCKPTGPCHPLPFDEKYLPKPAAESMLKVLQNC